MLHYVGVVSMFVLGLWVVGNSRPTVGVGGVYCLRWLAAAPIWILGGGSHGGGIDDRLHTIRTHGKYLK
jgi:hypothetical protein